MFMRGGAFLLVVVLGVLSVSQTTSANAQSDSHRNTTHLSGRERATQAKLNRTTRTATVSKIHKRTIPGKVANINYETKTFDLIKGNKTYKVNAATVGVTFVNRKWQPLVNGINDIQNGHKVTVKGTVTGLDVVATSVRDINLPVKSVSSTE
jgi:hypothetical protein